MKLRHACILLMVIFLAACGGPAEEPAAETPTPAPAAEAPMDDRAALDEMTEYFVTHYNMHHADMVAALYAEDAVFLAADGEWQTGAVITNYDEPPPPDLPRGEAPAEAPPELTDSPLSELTEYYATHFNMGHGDMVASRYAEDAVAAFANMPMASGRAAIAEQLNARVADGNPQLTIHEVEAMDIGDGWFVGGGWYESSSASGDTSGAYILLARAGDDGNMQIHWVVTNGNPVTQ